MRIRLILAALWAAALAYGPGPAAATSHSRLINFGGPVLSNFTIYPLYYGDWSGPVNQAVQQANQAYLQGLAQYLSGQAAPSGQKPTPWQYMPAQTMSVSLAPLATAGTNVTGPKQICDTLNLSTVCAPQETTVNDIIHASQANKTLPAYNAGLLIMVFLPQGFTISFAPGQSGCSYHWFENNSSFYATVQTDASCGPLLAVTGHELFEAVTDPAVGQGWDGTDGQESVDVCNIFTTDRFNLAGIDGAVANIVTQFTAANPGMTFPWSPSVKAAVPGIADNTQPDPANPATRVLCSKTGYYTPPAPPTPPQLCTSATVGGSSK